MRDVNRIRLAQYCTNPSAAIVIMLNMKAYKKEPLVQHYQYHAQYLLRWVLDIMMCHKG